MSDSASRSPGGRPALSSADRRKKHTIWFSPAERASIDRRAAAAGLRFGAFVRAAALGKAIGHHTRGALRLELQRQGNNLNQMTKLAHQMGEVEITPELERLLARLEDLYTTLAREVSG